MRVISSSESTLRRLFSGLVEQTFQTELAVADPSLTDYLAELLCRFVRFEALHRLRDTSGRRLEDVVSMIEEAEMRRSGPRREIHRHIGDFTLFWSGVYPEALPVLRSPHRRDHLLDYCEQGKRSYYIASTYDDERYSQEAPVLRRLSDEFDLCRAGLSRVRREWERLADSSDATRN